MEEKKYLLVVNGTSSFPLESLSSGESLTTSCSFVEAHYDEDGTPTEVVVKIDTGSSYEHEETIEDRTIPLGRSLTYVHHSTDITGPTDWEEDDDY